MSTVDQHEPPREPYHLAAVDSEVHSTSAQQPQVSRQFIWVIAGKILAAALQAICLALTARWMGPQQFGFLATALAVVIFGQAAADLGISTFIIQERARAVNSALVARALELSDRMSILLTAAMCAAVCVLMAVGVPQAAPLLLLAVTAGADRNAECWLGILIADGKAAMSSFMLIARRSLILALLLGLHSLGAGAFWAYCIVTALLALTASVVAHRLIRPSLSRAFKAPYKVIYAQTKHYWYASLFSQIRNLDVFIVGSLAGVTQAAYYSVAIRVTGPIGLLPTSLSAVLLPSAARSQHSDKAYSKVIRSAIVGLFTAVILYAVIEITVPWMIGTFLGQEYGSAATPVRVVVAGLCFASGVALLSALLNARGLSRSVSRAAGLTTATCLTMITILTPGYGATGAAIGFVIGYAVNFLILVFVAWKCDLHRAVGHAVRPQSTGRIRLP